MVARRHGGLGKALPNLVSFDQRQKQETRPNTWKALPAGGSELGTPRVSRRWHFAL
jgi:hypothetical protein